jgi:hypothetical protein
MFPLSFSKQKVVIHQMVSPCHGDVCFLVDKDQDKSLFMP